MNILRRGFALQGYVVGAIAEAIHQKNNEKTLEKLLRTNKRQTSHICEECNMFKQKKL